MDRLTPLHVFGARNRDEYVAAQAKYLRVHRRGLVPRPAGTNPTVMLQSDGAMRIKCVCGDYPLVDPPERLACCFNCGLIYDGLTVPDEGGT